MSDTNPAETATTPTETVATQPATGDGKQSVTGQPPRTLETAEARIKELNAENLKMRRQIEAAEKAAADAEAARLAEQGQYKALYEKAQADAQAAADRVARMEHDQLRRDAAQAAGIPQLWQRLQGETAEALAEDAKALAAMMQPAAGRAATTPPTPQPQPGGPTDFVKQAIERQQKRATENDPYAAMRKR